jgi:glycerol uptake facilitator protein
MEENSTIQKLIAEVFGTAFLVFIGVGSVPATLHLAGKTVPFTMADLGMISFAFALAVIAMVYTLGHVSGCHINPAVTLSLAATGKFPWKDVPGYIVAQVIGATLGALAIVGVLGTEATRLGLGVASYAHSVGPGRAMFAEGIGTFILVFVVFGVIDKRATPGFAGLVIGFAVFAIIIVVAPATSASINPARTIGPMIILAAYNGTVHWSQLPVYLGGEFAGGILAALTYLAIANPRRIALDGPPAEAEPVAVPDHARKDAISVS